MSAGGGWFAVYRSVFEKYEGRPEDLAAWLWILSWTFYAPAGGLGRGEVRFSIRRLAAVMGWSRMKAHRFVGRLIRDDQIRYRKRDTKRDSYGTTYFVVNYDKYQPGGVGDGTPNEPESGTIIRSTRILKKGNGVAETPKSEGGDAVLTERPVTKKRRAAKKPRSLSEQRDFLAAEIRKSEADA